MLAGPQLLPILIAMMMLGVAGCYQSHQPRDPDPGFDAGPPRRDAGRPDAGPPDAGRRDAGHDAGTRPDAGPIPCGDGMCAAGEICITGRCAGCCDLPPECIPIPSGCDDELGCGCFDGDPCGGCTTCQTVLPGEIVCGDCMCACAAKWTPIATPSGPRRIVDLRAGDLVYSVNRDHVEAVPIARVRRLDVTRHAMVHVTLENGEVVDMSGTHPTADGRSFASLRPGDLLGSARIASIDMAPYDEPQTYDILPASDTGTYFVHGAWIGSTLFVPTTAALTLARASR